MKQNNLHDYERNDSDVYNLYRIFMSFDLFNLNLSKLMAFNLSNFNFIKLIAFDHFVFRSVDTCVFTSFFDILLQEKEDYKCDEDTQFRKGVPGGV